MAYAIRENRQEEKDALISDLRTGIELLRKKLNDVLIGAAITSQQDLHPNLLLKMADSLLEFLHRGDPAIDARMKLPDRRWFATVEYRLRPYGDHREAQVAMELHPLIWLTKQDVFRIRIKNMTEIPLEVYEQIKHYYPGIE